MVIVMFKISDVTKHNLEYSLGIALDDFNKMSAEEERKWILEKRNRTIYCSRSILTNKKIRSNDDLNHISYNLYGI